MGRKKPTNRELTEGIISLHKKVEIMCSATQRVLSDFIKFLKKEDKFKAYLEKKYADTKQSKDLKKSK